MTTPATSPSISVVIPMRNAEKTIAKTLDSAMGQAYMPIEIIVIDDGSKDDSPYQVKALSLNPVRLIRQEHQGVSIARNTGIAHAYGDIVAFLDADDEWNSRYLSTIVQLAKDHPECSIFATGYAIEDSTGHKRQPHIQDLNFTEDSGEMTHYFAIAAHSYPPLWTSAVAVKRSAIEAIGGFPAGIHAGEDLLTWARLATQYRIAYHRDSLATYHAPHSNERNKHLYSDKKDPVGKELSKLINDIPDNQHKDFHKYMSLWFKIRAGHLLHAGHRKTARQMTRKALKHRPGNWKLYTYWFATLLPVALFQLAQQIYHKLHELVKTDRARV